jgi:protocatechuate 3,4-dioxygenase, beta subunit
MTDPVPFRLPAMGSQPGYDVATYGSTKSRHPRRALVRIPTTITEATGPQFNPRQFAPMLDMTAHAGGAAQGERIIVRGRVRDENGRAVANSMVELWQANAGGRYDHPGDTHDAPLDPHFHGEGRVFTDADGWYEFTTIKPGAYPWRNHFNGWRPNHIHFSLFGAGFATRLITQMYFPGDPLLALDPIYLGVPDRAAREWLVAAFDLETTKPDWALGYRFDIVLRGRDATPMENPV